MSEKTTAPTPAAPQDVVPRRKGGGQPGNRNAWKSGAHRKELREMRKQIARWMRTTNALIEEARKELHKRSPSPFGGRG